MRLGHSVGHVLFTLSCGAHYATMSTAGGVDVVQSQLRTSLITELQLSVDGSLVALDHTLTNSDGLVFTVANSLVACHLRKANFEYSLGVFLSESGLQQHKVCSLLPSLLLNVCHLLIT